MSKALSSALTLKRRPAPDDPTLPAILEFQWPSTAIVNAPVPRSARGIVWVVASMVLALVIISALIPIDRVVTAQGIVVSKSPTILVQPLDTAIVRSIDVHEGQQVKAGHCWRGLIQRLRPPILPRSPRRSRASTPRSRACKLRRKANPLAILELIPTGFCRLRSTPIERPSSIQSSLTIDIVSTSSPP